MNKLPWSELRAVPLNDILEAILDRRSDVELMQENLPLIITEHFTVPRDMLGTPEPNRQLTTYKGMPVRDNPFDAWIDRMLYGNSCERIKRS